MDQTLQSVMVKVSKFGVIAASIMETLRKVLEKDKEKYIGMMVESTKVCGITIR